MSEMVERVARAIYDGRNGRGARAWASLPRSHQSPYFSDARAAIEAMREPTDAMLLGGHFIAVENACDTQCAAMTDRRMGRAYRAMIDASLHEGEAER